MSDDVINGYTDTARNIPVSLKPLSFYLSVILHIALLIMIIVFYPGYNGGKKVLTEINLQSNPAPNKEYESTGILQKNEIKKVSVKEETIQKKNSVVKRSLSSADSLSNNTTDTIGGNTGTGLSQGGVNGNTVTLASDYYYVAVDQMPVPVGGMQSILSRMNSTENNAYSASIYILAFIDESGNVQKCLLIKGTGGSSDQLALNVVKKTKFQPGILNGRRVKVQLYISIPIAGN